MPINGNINAFLLFSNDICDPNGAGNFTMCPLCDGRCTYWKLESSCRYSRATYLFDNYGTMIFAVVMALWGKSVAKYIVFKRFIGFVYMF